MCQYTPLVDKQVTRPIRSAVAAACDAVREHNELQVMSSGPNSAHHHGGHAQGAGTAFDAPDRICKHMQTEHIFI